MTSKPFTTHGRLEQFVHVDAATQDVFVSPFAVAVTGLHNEQLGVGRVIGRLPDAWGGMPIVEIQDGDSAYEVLGAECRWRCPVDDAVIDRIASRQDIMRASAYVALLERNDF
jgi:hypothetical protein